MSIVNHYKNLNSSNRFLITFGFWLLVLFGLFYWGNYYSLSPIGKALDSAQRAIIMPILDATLNNQIINYDIIINSKFRIIITPECNGLIPYLMLLSAILAYECKVGRKIIWAILSYIVISIVNIIRLIIVVNVVNNFGPDSFYYIHDIAGNILLILTGSLLFLFYIKKCNVKKGKM